MMSRIWFERSNITDGVGLREAAAIEDADRGAEV